MLPPGGRSLETRMEDYAIRGLAVATILNVNNVIYMMTGVRQIGSFVIFVLAAGVLWRCGSHVRSTPFFLFFSAISTYLLFGWYFTSPFSVESAGDYVSSYLATIAVVWSFGSYFTKYGVSGEGERFLRFLRGVLIVAVASIWLSPLLTPLWRFLPLGVEEQRYSGFFGNPNESGFVACYAFALTLVLAKRPGALQTLLALFCFVGVLLSFSKTAIIVVVIVMLVCLLPRLRLPQAIVMMLFAAGTVALFWSSPADVFYWGAEQKLIELTPTQQERFVELGQFLEGQFDDSTTTNRTAIWQFGINKLEAQLPAGAGFGEYTHMVGGVWGVDDWLGVHNTFLMLLGEAGPAPFVLLIICLIAIVLKWGRSHYRILGIAFFVILVADLMSNHSALLVRYANAMFGIVLALASTPAAKRGLRLIGGSLSVVSLDTRH